jgi:hypothetical protein
MTWQPVYNDYGAQMRRAAQMIIQMNYEQQQAEDAAFIEVLNAQQRRRAGLAIWGTPLSPSASPSDKAPSPLPSP